MVFDLFLVFWKKWTHFWYSLRCILTSEWVKVVNICQTAFYAFIKTGHWLGLQQVFLSWIAMSHHCCIYLNIKNKNLPFWLFDIQWKYQGRFFNFKGYLILRISVFCCPSFPFTPQFQVIIKESLLWVLSLTNGHSNSLRLLFYYSLLIFIGCFMCGW